MSFDNNSLTKTNSRASSTRSSLLSRASGFMMGSRRSHPAPQSQPPAAAAAASSSTSPQRSSSSANPNTEPHIGADNKLATKPQASEPTAPRKFDHIFTAPDPSVKLSPPASLSHLQQAKYDQMLQHFKSIQEYPTSLKSNSPTKPLDDWEKLRNLSRESLLRYLRATKWDVPSAKKRLTDTIAWRREYGVDTLNPHDLQLEAKTGKETILGYDNRGRPLHYMHPSRNTTEETPRQMQYAVWMLERAIDLMPPGVEMLALLINFGGKKRNPTSIANAKLMLYILQNHYVERLGIALCINVPWIFKAFWNAIYPFIDPVTKAKCKFDEAVKDEVPNAQLASDFGGLLDFPYEHDKYWPQLLELTNKRRQEQLQRFRTQCNAQIGASEWVIRGGDQLGRSITPHKQDSGFHQVDALNSAHIEKRDDSSNTHSMPTHVEKPVPSYQPIDAADDDSQLDRFYTTQSQLPPQLQPQLESREASDWENKTIVNHEHADSASANHSRKHSDTGLFAAVVGGVSAGLVGGKAASDAAEQVHHSTDESHDKHKHQHLEHIKAVFHRKSESENLPAHTISAS